MATDGIKVKFLPDLGPVLDGFKALPGRVQPELDAIGRVVENEVRRGKIQKGFAEIPGVAHREAKRAANLVIKEMDRMAAEVERDAKEAANALKRIEAEAARIQKEAASKQKQGLGAVFGSGMINDIDDVAGALETMGPIAGMAASGGIALGVAFAGAAVEIAAVSYVAYELGSALYEAAESTGRLKDEQATLQLVTDSLQQTIGRDYVPQAEAATNAASALVLATQDLYEGTRDANREFEEATGITPRVEAGVLALATGQGLLNAAVREGTFELMRYLDPFGTYQDQVDSTNAAEKARLAALARVPAALKAKAEWEERLKRIQADTVAAAEKEEREKAAAAKKAADDQRRSREKAAADELKLATDLADGRAKIARMEQEAADESNDEMEASIKARITSIDAIHQTASKKTNKANEQAAQEYRDAWISSSAAVVGAVGTVTQLIIDSANNRADALIEAAKDGTDAEKEAAIASGAAIKESAMLAYSVNKGAGVASITIDTAMAIVKALAELGPVAGAVAGVGIGITSAAQVGAVLAAPPPFHTGGRITGDAPRVPGGAPDERYFRGRVGEVVETRQQQGGGQTLVLVNKVDHRVMSVSIQRQLKTSNSPLNRAITEAKSRTLGHSGGR